MGLFVLQAALRQEAVTQAAQERNANYEKNKMPSRLTDPVNKRKMEVDIRKSQIRSET